MISSKKALVVKNVIITTAGTYAEYFLAIISSALIARSLGPNEYGIYAYIIWVCGWMIRLSNISLPGTVIRFIAESRGAGKLDVSEKIAGILLKRQTITSFLVCIGFIVLFQFYKPDILQSQPDNIALLICVAVFFKSRYAFLVSIAKGYERFDIEAISTIAVGLVSTSAVLVLTLTEQGLSSFVTIFAITCILIFLVARKLCKKNTIKYKAGEIDPDYLKKIHNYRRLSTVLGSMAMFSGITIGMFLLGQYGTSVQVGFLALSVTLTRGLKDLVTIGLNAVLMPHMAHAFGASDIKAVRSIFLESTRFYVFFGIGLGLVGLLITKPIITILYGDEYLEAIWVFSSLLLINGFSMSGAAMGSFMSTTDRQDLRLKFSIAGLVVSVLCSLMLIPPYGLKGVMLALGIASVFRLLLGFQWIARNLGAIIPYKLYSKLLICGIVALAPVLLLTLNTDLLLIDVFSVVIFVILYPVLTIQFSCWEEKDLNLVKHLLGLLPSSVNKYFFGILRKYDL